MSRDKSETSAIFSGTHRAEDRTFGGGEKETTMLFQLLILFLMCSFFS